MPAARAAAQQVPVDGTRDNSTDGLDQITVELSGQSDALARARSTTLRSADRSHASCRADRIGVPSPTVRLRRPTDP